MKIIGAFLVFLGCIMLVAWLAIRIVSGIQFDRNCEGYLKRAADANTVEIAKQQLDTAISYLDANRMTTGYTSIIYNTPDEDVEFWYNNLVASSKELERIMEKQDATQLEQTNVLMKLRETLLDEDQSTTVTSPEGISIYPYNIVMCWMLFVVPITLVVFGGLIVTATEL